MKEFIQMSPAKDLEEVLLLSTQMTPNQNQHWLEQIKISLGVRIAEQAAESASKLITHTEQLSKQTERAIQHSELLIQQNKTLVNESQKLGRLTWGLFFLTIALILLTAGLLWIDWNKEHVKANVSLHPPSVQFAADTQPEINH